MKVLIVGGVAGGASTATRLRRIREDAEIIMFEKGDFVSYANCGLPYYIGGVIKDKEKLVVTHPDLFRTRFNIDVRTNSEVIKINPEKKTVLVKDHISSKEYEESYDKLVLSPGASPAKPNIKGLDSQGVFTLRTIPDTLQIDEYISVNNAKKAVIIGGGFIGVEIAENLRERRLGVSVIDFAPQVLTFLDEDMAAIVQKHMEKNGVRLYLNKGVSQVDRQDNKLKVTLSSDEVLTADIVILAAGISPDSEIASMAGVKVGEKGGIIVDKNFETSIKDIYAVGDAIETTHFITETKVMLPLAGPANKQGRMLADILADVNNSNKKPHTVQGTSILKVFDLTAGSTGMNEKQLKDAGIEYLKTYIHPLSHAGYYPGATQLNMKMLFSPKGNILGAQIVGYQGVDKRIDVISTAIRLSATVYDLEDLELAYAPPYSSAKDPVNMLGYTAVNMLRGDVKSFNVSDIPCLDLDKVQLVDVRTPYEYQQTIKGAINIPLDTLRDNLHKLDKEKPVYIFCRVGQRGYLATRILSQNGFDAYNLAGGYMSYVNELSKKDDSNKLDCLGLKK